MATKPFAVEKSEPLTVVSFRAHRRAADLLAREARRLGRSKTSLIREALNHWFDCHRPPDRLDVT